MHFDRSTFFNLVGTSPISFYNTQAHRFLLSNNALRTDNLLSVSICVSINMEKSHLRF